MPRPIGGTGVGRWAVVGTVLYAVGYAASLLGVVAIEGFVLEPAGIRVRAGELSLSAQNGVHHVIWGLVVAAAAVPIGRRLVSGIRFEAAGAALLSVGLVLAGLTELLLNEFVRARYGYFDPEATGWAILAPPAIVAVALAVWAAMAVPIGRRAPLLVLALAAAGAFVVVMLPSMGGLTDGLDPESLGLASSLIASAGFIVLGLVLARR